METRFMEMRFLPVDTRDIGPEVLDERGRLRVMPASYYATTTQAERSAFCVRHGAYVLPTHEMIERLRVLIGDRTAIEIGSGNGAVAKALGIPATDSRMQEVPEHRDRLRRMRQAPVPYGDHVRTMDARTAIRHYRPAVVVGCWVTHKFTWLRPDAGGNQEGIDEDWIVDRADYLVVGNPRTHAKKNIWRRPHAIEHPPYVYSRALNGTPDFIALWKRSV